MRTHTPTSRSPLTPRGKLTAICNVILDEHSSQQNLHNALDDFSNLCSQITDITPSPTFDAWAEDTFLEQGVAINPQAAAFCIKDYQRSIIFIRGVNAAFNTTLNASSKTPINLLYAGCGPFATLVIPLLGKYLNDGADLSQLNIHLLDIHQTSLDSVSLLLNYFDISTSNITLIQANACTYQHREPLHLIISETMQKSLEQEPQFTITANLAPQLSADGIFIPERIVVQLCLGQWKSERRLVEQGIQINHEELVTLKKRVSLGTILNLQPKLAATQLKEAQRDPNTNKLALKPTEFQIPELAALDEFDLLLLTKIIVFKHYQLNDYESEITLPSKCQTPSALNSKARYNIRYQLGNYPEFYVGTHHTS
jgi:hypothetical protein